eukprot:1141803-Pelagomonas_calceolata.AAC.5
MYHITPGSIVLFFVPPLPLELLLLDSGRCCMLVCMQVTLPLEIGSRVHCKWRNQDYYRSKVIERRVKPDIELPEGAQPKPEDYEYYMHYFGCECDGVHTVIVHVTCMLNEDSQMQHAWAVRFGWAPAWPSSHMAIWFERIRS